MQRDDPLAETILTGRTEAEQTSVPGSSRALASWAMAVLIVVTSLVLGVAASWWYVPVYLVVMGWLIAPAESHSRGSKRAPTQDPLDRLAGQAESRAEDSPRNPDEREHSGREELEDRAEPNLSREPEAKQRRGRSKKSRKRNPSPVAFEAVPDNANWVRIGPGKFVRVDSSGTASGDSSEPLVLHGETLPAEKYPPEPHENGLVGGNLNAFVPAEQGGFYQRSSEHAVEATADSTGISACVDDFDRVEGLSNAQPDPAWLMLGCPETVEQFDRPAETSSDDQHSRENPRNADHDDERESPFAGLAPADNPITPELATEAPVADLASRRLAETWVSPSLPECPQTNASLDQADSSRSEPAGCSEPPRAQDEPLPMRSSRGDGVPIPPRPDNAISLEDVAFSVPAMTSGSEPESPGPPCDPTVREQLPEASVPEEILDVASDANAYVSRSFEAIHHIPFPSEIQSPTTDEADDLPGTVFDLTVNSRDFEECSRDPSDRVSSLESSQSVPVDDLVAGVEEDRLTGVMPECPTPSRPPGEVACLSRGRPRQGGLRKDVTLSGWSARLSRGQVSFTRNARDPRRPASRGTRVRSRSRPRGDGRDGTHHGDPRAPPRRGSPIGFPRRGR